MHTSTRDGRALDVHRGPLVLLVHAHLCCALRSSCILAKVTHTHTYVEAARSQGKNLFSSNNGRHAGRSCTGVAMHVHIASCSVCIGSGAHAAGFFTATGSGDRLACRWLTTAAAPHGDTPKGSMARERDGVELDGWIKTNRYQLVKDFFVL